MSFAPFASRSPSTVLPALSISPLLLFFLPAPGAIGAPGDIVASFAIPGVSTYGPRGLAASGTGIYAVADNRAPYQVRILKFEYVEAQPVVKSQFNCPASVYWATDIAWRPGYIYVANDFTPPSSQSWIAVVPEAGGPLVASFPSPYPPGVHCNGLTWDGYYLYASSYESPQIYRLTTDGSVVSSFTAPHAALNGLAFNGTSLLAVAGRPFYDASSFSGAGAPRGSFTFDVGNAYVGGACHARPGTIFISTFSGPKLVFEIDTGLPAGGVAVFPASLGRVKTLFR